MSPTANRLTTAASVAAAIGVAVAVVPRIGLMPADLELRFQLTYMNLVFAVYAAVLGAFMVWRVRDRPGAQELGVVLGLMSLALALTVVPLGDPSLPRRLAFGLVWSVLNLAVVRFWTRFPQHMDMRGVEALAKQEPAGLWHDRPNRVSARLVHWTLSRPDGRALLALGVVAFSFILVGPDAAPYNLLAPQPDLGLQYMIVAGPLAVAVILFIVMVAWTSFRLADQRGQRQILWAMSGHFLPAFLAVMIVALAVARALTGSTVLSAIHQGLAIAFNPVGWAVTLTGYALAIFLSGAFDLRPLIGRSTVYGATIVVLTFLFAGVEEAVQAQLATRMALPDGVGTWVGAASIAIFLGPLRTRLERVLTRWVPELRPSGALPSNAALDAPQGAG